MTKAVHDVVVDPGWPLLREIGGAGLAVLDQDGGSALVGAAESIRHAQGDLVFTVDVGSTQG